MDKLVHVKTADFDALIAEKTPVFVEFWAPWCGPCRMVGPYIEALAEEYGDRAVIAKVNVDEEAELAERFNVSTIPTALLFAGGQVVDKSVGARSKQAFADMIDKVL